MFSSISIATPNSTVTSSFVAVEDCVIDIDPGLVTRVNGSNVTDRPFNVLADDLVEVDVESADNKGHLFVPYTYDEEQCYFAVVSSGGGTKRTMKPEYLGHMPTELAPNTTNIPNLLLTSSDTESTLFNTGGGDGTPQDRVAIMGGPLVNDAPYIAFYRTNGTQLTRDFPSAAGMDATNVWNNGNRTWEQYYLLSNGKIFCMPQNYASAYSTTVYSGAKTIFSDTVSLFVGGFEFLHILSDFDTIEHTFTLTGETIYGGAALGVGAIVTTNTGNLYKLTNNGLELLHSAEMMGKPTVFNGQYVVPVPTEWALRIYDQDFNLVNTIDAGDRLPMYAQASRSELIVTHASSGDIAIYTDLESPPTIKTFSKYVTFATSAGGNVFASTRFNTFEMTFPPSPAVNGINLVERIVPANVDVGSGEFIISTIGQDLPVFKSPNIKLYLDRASVESDIANSGNMISVMLRSNSNKAQGAFIVGDYAFDFKLSADIGEHFSRYVEVMPKDFASSVTFTITVPDDVEDEPIALSSGMLQVNNVVHNGVSKISSGDELKITLYAPDGQTYFYSMLSFADAQYALVVNTASKTIADTQEFQTYGTLSTVSTITIDEPGVYDFPNYTNAKVFKDGEEVVFPIELIEGDVLEIHHVRASNLWLDKRDTVLIGPTSTYVVESVTTVNDMPANVYLGRVHMGIPDFDFAGEFEEDESIPVISGLSDGYSIQIYSDHMKFKVNGSEPQATPMVKNGDTIEAIYTVQNLFDRQGVKTNLHTGQVYTFGYLEIDPALGQFAEPKSNWDGQYTDWLFVEDHHPEETDASTGLLVEANVRDNEASVGSFAKANTRFTPANTGRLTHAKQLPTPASLGKYNTATVSTAKVERGARFSSSKDLAAQLIRQTIANSSIGRKGAPVLPYMKQTTAAKSKKMPYSHFVRPASEEHERPFELLNLDKTDTYITLVSDHEMAFGKSANFQTFLPAFDYESSAIPVSATPFYVFENDPSARNFWPNWKVFEYQNTSEKDMGFQDFKSSWSAAEMVWLVPVNAQNAGAKSPWIRHIGNISAKDLDFVSEVKETQAGKTMLSKSVKPVSAAAVYSPSVVYASASSSTVAVKGKVAGELYSSNNHTNKAGGFSTYNQAQAAAEAATDKEIEVYQQPEGTFGYIVKRDTGLVCEVRSSGLVVVAWLMGGG